MNRSTVNNINIKKFYFKRRRLFKNDNIARVTQKYNFKYKQYINRIRYIMGYEN